MLKLDKINNTKKSDNFALIGNKLISFVYF